VYFDGRSWTTGSGIYLQVVDLIDFFSLELDAYGGARNQSNLHGVQGGASSNPATPTILFQ
jgi:hypothetical protein